MNKEELMARVNELREAEAEAMLKTLLVDVHTTVDRKPIAQMMSEIATAAGLNYKFVVDLVNPYTPEHKRHKAIMAVRLSKTPAHMVIVTRENKDVSSWVKTYTDKGIETHIYVVDMDHFYSADEYLDIYGKEMLLDAIMRTRHSADRELLEEIAESFSTALGWSFSGPIREKSLTSEYLDKFMPKTVVPYAGWKGNYSFALSIHQFNDTLVEEPEVGSKLTITPSNRTKLMVGKACPTEELLQFREFLMALIENNLLEDALEDSWNLCECGNPVRNIGQTAEDGFCDYCDRPIKNFRLVIYEDVDRIARPEPGYVQVDNSLDTKFWIDLIKRIKFRRLGLPWRYLRSQHNIRSLVYYNTQK